MTTTTKPGTRLPAIVTKMPLAINTRNQQEPASSFQPRGHLSEKLTTGARRRLHRKQAAVYLGMSLSWLDKTRLRGDGPTYLQIGGRVVYDTADLDAFLAQHRRTSTAG